jgi:hypothetical protein
MMLFKEDISPHIAIQDKLEKLRIPISFIIGDDDWVRGRIGEADKEIAGEEHAHSCPASGHSLQQDNPRELSKIMIKEIVGHPESNTAAPS